MRLPKILAFSAVGVTVCCLTSSPASAVTTKKPAIKRAAERKGLNVPIELAFLQDCTSSFEPLFSNITAVNRELVANLIYEFDQIKFAVTLAGDRDPLEYCQVAGVTQCAYENLTPLTDDTQTVYDAFDNFHTLTSPNNIEDQLEVAAYMAANLSGFTPYKENDNIVRIIFIATDDQAHISTDPDDKPVDDMATLFDKDHLDVKKYAYGVNVLRGLLRDQGICLIVATNGAWYTWWQDMLHQEDKLNYTDGHVFEYGDFQDFDLFSNAVRTIADVGCIEPTCYQRGVSIELALLQDATASFPSDLTGVKDIYKGLVSNLTNAFDNIKFALTLFGDRDKNKPCTDQSATQCAYLNLTPLTDDIDTINDAIDLIHVIETGAAVDDPLEVAAYMAGTLSGFTPYKENDGIIRVILIVTNDIAQLNSDPNNAPFSDIATDFDGKATGPFTGVNVLKKALQDRGIYLAVATDASNYDYWQDILHGEDKFNYTDGQYGLIDYGNFEEFDLLLNSLQAVVGNVADCRVTTTTTPLPLACDQSGVSFELGFLQDGTYTSMGWTGSAVSWIRKRGQLTN